MSDRINARRIDEILRDADFVRLITRIEGQLTAKVMARATTPEDRAEALADYHAIKRLIAAMGNVAGEAAKE